MRCILANLLREQLGGLERSLEWSISQNFAFASVSSLDLNDQNFKKEIFVPRLDT
jgi:hypothetical protein